MQAQLLKSLVIATVLAAFTRQAAAQSRSSIETGDTSVAARDTPPDRALMKRWASLTADLLGEFRRNRRSPVGNIQGDYSTMEIKVRADSTRDDTWVSRTLTNAELRTGDMRTIAKDLYATAERKIVP